MTTDEISRNFNITAATWEKTLDTYSNSLFSMKPDAESWSIGQVYQHLITVTHRIFTLIDKCLAGNSNEQEQKSEEGVKAFKNNDLGDIQVKVPASIQATPLQPANKEIVRAEFKELKNRFAEIAEKVKNSNGTGKEKHGRLGFLNAIEWLQLADIHARHHLRQKERIDAFLKTSNEVKKHV